MSNIKVANQVNGVDGHHNSDADSKKSPQRSPNPQKQLTYASYLKNPNQSKLNIKETLGALKKDVTKTSPSRSPPPVDRDSSPRKSRTLKIPVFEIAEYVPKEYLSNPSDKNQNLEQRFYSERFYDHKKVNQGQIHSQLQQMVKQQITDRLDQDESVGLPTMLGKNRDRWALSLIKDKKLQQVICKFTDQIALILDDELQTNSQLTKDYLRHPHSQSPTNLSPPPFNNTEFNPAVKSNLSKAKQHLADLQMKNKKRVQEEQAQQEMDKITDEVLKGITQEHFQKVRSRPMQSEKVKVYKHPQATELKERMENTKELLRNLEQSQLVFRHEVQRTELELLDIEEQSDRKSIPGNAISHLLQKWAAEPVLTNEQIDKRAAELWKTKEQFEKELAADVEKSAVIIKKVKQDCIHKITLVREQASFRMEGLETALTTVKAKCIIDVERASMRLSEIESTLMNIEKSDEKLSEDVETIDNILNAGFVFDTDAGQKQITKLVAVMKSTITAQQQSINSGVQECKRQVGERIEAEQKLANFIPTYISACEITQQYMQLMWGIADQSQIFTDESVLPSKVKEQFYELKNLDEELTKSKMKGTDYYSENIMPQIQAIHDIWTDIDMPKIFNLYVYNQNEKSKIVMKLFALDEKQQKMQAGNSGYQTAQQISQAQIRKTLMDGLKRHVSVYVAENTKQATEKAESDWGEEMSQDDLSVNVPEVELKQPDQKQTPANVIGVPNPTGSLSKPSLESGGVQLKTPGTQQNQKVTIKQISDSVPQPSSAAQQKVPSKQQIKSSAAAAKVGKPGLQTESNFQVTKSIDRWQQSSLPGDGSQIDLPTNFKHGSSEALSSDEEPGDDYDDEYDDDGLNRKSKYSKGKKEEATKQQPPTQKQQLGNKFQKQATVSNGNSGSNGPWQPNIQKVGKPSVQAQGKESKNVTQLKTQAIKATIDKFPSETQVNRSTVLSQRATVVEINRDLSINSDQDPEEVEELKTAHQDLSTAQQMQLLAKYRKELDQANLSTHQFDLKISGQDCRDLSQIFQQCLGEPLSKQDLSDLESTENFMYYFTLMNKYQGKFNNSLKNEIKGPSSDAIRPTVDALGQLHGFTLVPEMVRLVYSKGDNIQAVKKLVQKVGLMNRLLLRGDLQGYKEFNPAEEVFYSQEGQLPRQLDINLTDTLITSSGGKQDQKGFSDVLTDHLINVASLKNPEKRAEFERQYRGQSLDTLLQKKIQISAHGQNQGAEDQQQAVSITGFQYITSMIEKINTQVVHAAQEGGQTNAMVSNMLLGMVDPYNRGVSHQGSSLLAPSSLRDTSKLSGRYQDYLVNATPGSTLKMTSGSVKKVFSIRLRHEMENTISTMDNFIKHRQTHSKSFKPFHKSQNDLGDSPEHSLERIQKKIKAETDVKSPANARYIKAETDEKSPSTRACCKAVEESTRPSVQITRRGSDDRLIDDRSSHFHLPTVTNLTFNSRSQSTNTFDAVSTNAVMESARSPSLSKNQLNETQRPFRTLANKNQWEHVSTVSYRFPQTNPTTMDGHHDYLSTASRLLLMPSEQSITGYANGQSSGKTLAQRQVELTQNLEKSFMNQKGESSPHLNLMKSPRSPHKTHLASLGQMYSPTNKDAVASSQSGPSLFGNRAHEVNGILRRKNEKIQQILAKGPPDHMLIQ